MAASEARRTKIVATIGPASASEDVLRAMIAAGIDAARMNFSHATHEWHGEVIGRIRKLAAEAGRPIAILGDLQGPRIRTGTLAGGEAVEIEAGQPFTLTTKDVPGDARCVSTTYANLPADVAPGMTILVADGLLQLVVRRVHKSDVDCEVVVGGTLGEHKGINVPEASISAPAITEKDEADLAFMCEHGFDYAGLSFVRCGEDVRRARELAKSSAGRPPLIIGKIERREAVENLAEILAEVDGVMVARGDLGVETSSADVPILQKRIIEESNQVLRLDITATQMLASMASNPRPTRAEAADVANAIFDGTDAIMLSDETAAGRYPVKSVETMDAIARLAEENLERYGRHLVASAGPTTTAATASAACLAADELSARAIVVFTMSGSTARVMSGRRPRTPIIAVTPDETTWRALSLVWGVTPVRIPMADHAAGMFRSMEEKLLKEGLLEYGDLIVATVGATTVEGATNVMKVHVIGDVGAPAPRP